MLFTSHILLERYSPSISYIFLSTDSLVLVVFQDRNIIHHWCELMCTTFIILHTTTWCALMRVLIPLLRITHHITILVICIHANICSNSWQFWRHDYQIMLMLMLISFHKCSTWTLTTSTTSHNKVLHKLVSQSMLVVFCGWLCTVHVFCSTACQKKCTMLYTTNKNTHNNTSVQAKYR